MDSQWTGHFGNTSSDALRAVWQQLCDAFNANIASHDDPGKFKKWIVLQPPTGSGKTQGLIVYCSMLSEMPAEKHPGVLIVTRFIEEADRIVREINRLKGNEIAIAHHSKSDGESSELQNYPVLSITHNGYLKALARVS